MDRKPLVSVIVPTYNRPDFLRKTLQTILHQSFQDFELIVISNGFNPKNRGITNELNDPKILYWERERNSGGPAAPRNDGISKASGKYIAFCDDDDLWMPQKLEKQLTILESNPEYGLCYSNSLRFDDRKEWVIPHEEGAATLESLLYVNTVPISSIVVRKDLVDLLGGFCESKIVGISEDYEFLLKCSTKTKFYYINEYLIKYWSGDNRMSKTDTKGTMLDIFKYFFGVGGCYYLQVITRRISIKKFFLPVLYQLKLLCKSVGYNLLKEVGLK